MRFFAFAAFAFVYSNIGLANLHLAPPAFDLADRSGKAVFVDFVSAQYKLDIDVKAQSAVVTSTIVFNSEAEGFPIFDLVPEGIISVSLDGEEVRQELVSTPPTLAITELRVIKKKIKPGIHNLTIQHSYPEDYDFVPTFEDMTVRHGLFMYDDDDRGLLERHVPANFEFDQVAMKVIISIKGSRKKHIPFTNGKVEVLSTNMWSIEFPEHFTSSSPYLHYGAKNHYQVMDATFPSKNGTQLPVRLYKRKTDLEVDLEEFREEAFVSLSKFEEMLGAFPHPSVLIYALEGSRPGGMEYSGATETTLGALSHELAHSYFGRGVMPANGNAGWIDEAMATTIGGPFGVKDVLPSDGSNMGNYGEYFRANDGNGYFLGATVLAHLGKVANQTDVNRSAVQFMRDWFSKYNGKVITTELLHQELRSYCGSSTDSVFDKYVLGKELPDSDLEHSALGHGGTVHADFGSETN